MSEAGALCMLVRDFINQTCNLSALLKEDQQLIQDNQIIAIEETNTKKLQAIDSLQDLANKISAAPCLSGLRGNLYEQLQQYAGRSASAELNALLSEMNQAMHEYNQNMNINRRVIHANLAYLKDVLSALFQNQAPDESISTYDSQGLLEKA